MMMTSQQFPLAPVSAPLFYAIGVMLMMYVVVFAALTGYLLFSMQTVSLSVTSDRLEVSGLYGRAIDRSALKISDARMVNLLEDGDYLPVRRVNGIGLLGFKAGWFRLKNGEKALLFVSDSSHALHIPTTEDYVLMLSPRHPEAFLESLRGE